MKIDNTLPPDESGIPCHECKGQNGNSKWEIHFTPTVLLRLYPHKDHDLKRWKKGKYPMGKPLRQTLRLSQKTERGNGTTMVAVCDVCLKKYFNK